MQIISWIIAPISLLTKILNPFSHFVALALRYYMFSVFFYAGWQKYKSWSTTLMLFEYEYQVSWLPLPPELAKQFALDLPSLSHVWAAYAGTAAEIILPCLLLAGFGARLPAIGLFVFNYIAACSYPFLWTDAGIAGLKDHIIWGFALLPLIFYGTGHFSLDFFANRICRKYKY